MKIRMTIEASDKNRLLHDIIKKYHFTDGNTELLEKVFNQLIMYAEPYAEYRINQRMTGISAIDDGQSAIVSMTLGNSVDKLIEEYTEAGELDAAYMIDCISNELLISLYGIFNQYYARFHRRYVSRYYFVGNEIPLTKLPLILEDIRGKKKEQPKAENKNEADETVEVGQLSNPIYNPEQIRSNEYGALTPSKSVVFYAILSEDPKQICQGLCAGCNNEYCDNRIKNEDNKKNMQLNFTNLNYGPSVIFGGRG